MSKVRMESFMAMLWLIINEISAYSEVSLSKISSGLIKWRLNFSLILIPSSGKNSDRMRRMNKTERRNNNILKGFIYLIDQISPGTSSYPFFLTFNTCPGCILLASEILFICMRSVSVTPGNFFAISQSVSPDFTL